eukprot:COSAG02_NODE_10332_length_1966_cov_25.858597_2_plen_134_part_00
MLVDVLQLYNFTSSVCDAAYEYQFVNDHNDLNSIYRIYTSSSLQTGIHKRHHSQEDVTVPLPVYKAFSVSGRACGATLYQFISNSGSGSKYRNFGPKFTPPTGHISRISEIWYGRLWSHYRSHFTISDSDVWS